MNLAHKGRIWLAANWWWLIPILLSALVMAPRITSAQFGLEDDAKSLLNALRILAGSWSPADEAATGRFRPVYWLWFALIYAIAGPSPTMYFFVNWMVLALSTAGIALLLRRGRCSNLQAFLAATFFVLAGPVIEPFYTLSKSEPVQVFLLILALLLAQETARQPARGGRLSLGLLTALAVSLAILCKETSLIVIPISGAWLGLDLIVRRSRYDRTSLVMLLGTVAGVLIFFGARAFFVRSGIEQGGYTQRYDVLVFSVLSAIYRWGGWIIRDYASLFVAFILLPFLLRRPYLQAGKPYMFAALIWMAGWIVVFLPWEFTVEYYMLPLAVGAAAFGGIVFGATIEWFRTKKHPVLMLGLSTALVLFLPTFGNNISNARLQLAVDRENAAMLDYAVKAIEPQGRLFINLPSEAAYTDHTDLSLAVRGRADIQVAPFDLENPPSGTYDVATLDLKHQPLFFVRLGTYEQGAERWNAAFLKRLGPTSQPVFESQSSFRQSNTNLVVAACLFVRLEFCQRPTPFLDRRVLSYGWNIYHLVDR